MNTTANSDLYSIPLETIDGEATTLAPYKNNVLLIVNVASRCGFTPHYQKLQALYDAYKDQGLVIIGFPCNQFSHQEPGENAEIKTFAKSCYRVTFPLFAKIDVKGKNRAPLYTYLAHHILKKPLFLIPWNFTKILIDKKGNVLKRFGPWTAFKKIENEVKKALLH